MTRLAVVFLDRAKQELDEADEWWRSHRAPPDLVLEEISHFVELVADLPQLGAVAPSTRARGVRRLLLDRIGYWAYYRVQADRVEVLAVWHVRRGTGPRL